MRQCLLTIVFFVLQVLAVNILGRFLLNSDRNIRSVLLSSPASFITPGHFTFSLVWQCGAGLLTAGGKTDASQQALISLRSLINLPRRLSSRASPEGHCLSVNADLFILGLVIFHQALFRRLTGFSGFCYVLIFEGCWFNLHGGCVARQACLVFTCRHSDSHCDCVTVIGLVCSCGTCLSDNISPALT